MLTEISLTQNENKIIKRWFQDDYFDLFTWQNETGQITCFQLCYDRLGNERVISWDNEQGFAHYRVDDGEASPHKNMSPVFVKDGVFSSQEVMFKFLEAGTQITSEIHTVILKKLQEYMQRHSYE
jgi:hypothetical protein